MREIRVLGRYVYSGGTCIREVRVLGGTCIRRVRVFGGSCIRGVRVFVDTIVTCDCDMRQVSFFGQHSGTFNGHLSAAEYFGLGLRLGLESGSGLGLGLG